ncbi:MAG: STE like transcription factor-domain-containing protein [Olpidium bornovanus]|uniref:STE like transcription factor-domain-containing protein n=1 Tax=Olpidium bornovanus TaxID=278681 RepID=A0A8H8DK02_9FUNG|nr:MAG: STE like transcription factor-domain-containing protein [Olpidium bornovanus]
MIAATDAKAQSQLAALHHFLATAPAAFRPGENFGRFQLPNGEFISCVLWQGLFHITGTDIVRALVFRFEVCGRPIRNMKKFEEGVFSDLRNLKPGQDATLQQPRSEFLELLYKNGCIRTQKKQKVFYWFSVPHEKLFKDALQRDLRLTGIVRSPLAHHFRDAALLKTAGVFGAAVIGREPCAQSRRSSPVGAAPVEKAVVASKQFAAAVAGDGPESVKPARRRAEVPAECAVEACGRRTGVHGACGCGARAAGSRAFGLASSARHEAPCPGRPAEVGRNHAAGVRRYRGERPGRVRGGGRRPPRVPRLPPAGISGFGAPGAGRRRGPPAVRLAGCARGGASRGGGVPRARGVAAAADPLRPRGHKHARAARHGAAAGDTGVRAVRFTPGGQLAKVAAARAAERQQRAPERGRPSSKGRTRTPLNARTYPAAAAAARAEKVLKQSSSSPLFSDHGRFVSFTYFGVVRERTFHTCSRIPHPSIPTACSK